jgi:hypothetical protein
MEIKKRPFFSEKTLKNSRFGWGEVIRTPE